MLYSQIMQYTCFVLFNDEEDTARPNSLNISELHWCFMHGLDLRFGVGLNAALREEPVQSRCALKCGLTHGGKCWTRSVHGWCAPRLSSLGFIQVDQRLMVLFEVLTTGVLFIMASYFRLRNFFFKTLSTADVSQLAHKRVSDLSRQKFIVQSASLSPLFHHLVLKFHL